MQMQTRWMQDKSGDSRQQTTAGPVTCLGGSRCRSKSSLLLTAKQLPSAPLTIYLFAPGGRGRHGQRYAAQCERPACSNTCSDMSCTAAPHLLNHLEPSICSASNAIRPTSCPLSPETRLRYPNRTCNSPSLTKPSPPSSAPSGPPDERSV